MKVIFILLALVIYVGCTQEQPAQKKKSEIMVLKDGKFVSPRQVRAVTGD